MSSAAAYSPAALFLSSFSASIPPSIPPPPQPQPFNPDQEGSRFGPGLRYSLGRVIGHGGSSTVREGSDLGEGGQHRRVAIKIVNPTEDTPEQQQPHDEPALWKTLAPHPHLLPLLYHERCASHDLFVMPFCNRGNLLTHVRTEAGRRPQLPSNTPRLSRAGTLTSIFAAQSPSANTRAAGLPPTDTDTAADSHPFKVSRSHSINGPPDPHLRSRHPSSTGPPDSSSTSMRIVTPSKVGSLPRDSADSFSRLSMIPAGSEVSPTSNSRDSDFKLPYMGGGRSPSAAGSPSTSFISRHGSIRSIGSTRSRGQAAEWASRGVPLSAAREILRQLCEALTVLHCRTHLVHGDLKLENVLGQAAGLHLGSVSADGEGTNKASDDAMEVLREGEDTDATHHAEDICWRIADFGLSRKIQEDEHSPPEALKLAIDRGGTLPYAAPELLRERVQASPISPTAKSESAFHDNDNSPSPSHKDSAQSMASPYASDMWALGCILYALLSGRLPFVDSFEPRLQAKIVKAEWEMPARLRRARERRAAAAGASSSTAIVGGLPSQPRDSSDSPASAWSLRARTASADQNFEVVDDGTTSALSRFSRPSPGSGNGNGNTSGGGAHSWFPNRSGSQPATMRRMMSPQGLGRISSLSRAGRAGDPFGSSTSSSMFRGSSPLRESVLLDLQDLSASMPALSPPLGMGIGMGTTAESDALQPSVELDAEAGAVEAEIDSDAEEGHDVEWDGRSAERAAAREVLSGLLQPDPCRRWTVEQLSRSRWLSAEFADEGSISSNPFRRNLFRRMSEYEQEGIPSSLLAIVEDMRAGEPKKQSQQPWRRLPDKSPSPLPSGDVDPDPPSLVFERRAVSVERGGNRRASSLTRTRPLGDDVSNSSSRERIARPAVEEEDEGRGGPMEVEQNERLGRLGRDGRPKLDRFFAGAGVRSRSTSRLLEAEGMGAEESDGTNADASLRGRGRRMHSPATHQRRTGRSTSSQRSPHGLSHPRDSALEIVPLRSVSATRSRGFELADLTEDDLGSPRMSISPRMGPGSGSGSGSTPAAVGRDIRRRSARPIEIPQLDSNHPSDSDRSRSRSRSRARPPLSRSTSGTGNGGGGGGGPGGASVTTGSSTTQMDRREAMAKF